MGSVFAVIGDVVLIVLFFVTVADTGVRSARTIPKTTPAFNNLYPFVFIEFPFLTIEHLVFKIIDIN
jgi:hypothetical protein